MEKVALIYHLILPQLSLAKASPSWRNLTSVVFGSGLNARSSVMMKDHSYQKRGQISIGKPVNYWKLALVAYDENLYKNRKIVVESRYPMQKIKVDTPIIKSRSWAAR